jgi:phospholipase C
MNGGAIEERPKARKRHRSLPIGLVTVIVVMVGALAPSVLPHVESTAAAAVTPVGLAKIKHIVMVMQENRSFDEYFGTFPGANGIARVNGVPTACLPSTAGGCKRLYVDHRDLVGGGPHGTANATHDVDGGKMDGFLKESEIATQACVKSNAGCPDNAANVLGYHTESDIPNYWQYARNFALQDNMFQPNASWSLPAHLFQVSGWSASCPNHQPMSCVSDINQNGPQPDTFADPTNVSLNPLSPIYAWTDLTYLMHKQQVSWGYYVVSGNEPDCEDDEAVACAPVEQQAHTPGIWNPLPYFDTVRNDGELGNVQTVENFYKAAHDGTLPAVSWIVPSGDLSEHPPLGSTSAGQSFVTSLANAVGNSPDWDSTALFIAWDDWGGFYDHVQPPSVDVNGYGLRVPGMLVSPYAKRGYIDHQVLSFDAYLKLIEDVFLGGQRIDPHTDGRPDARPTVRENVAILGDLASEFDFTQAPRPPLILPVHPTTTLQNVPPYPPRLATVSAGDNSASLTWINPITAGGEPIINYKVVPYEGSTVLPASTFAATATSGVVKNVVDGHTYTFKLFATNSVGKGMLSPATPAVTIGAPSAPPTVSANPGSGTAAIHWTVPKSTNGSPISSYRVTPHKGAVALTPVTFPKTATGGTVTGLTNGQGYTFSVQALNARGAGAATITPVLFVGSPGLPQGVTATAGGPGSAAITVRWAPPPTSNGAPLTGFTVTTRFNTKTIATKAVASTARSLIVTGLMSGQPYTFVVSATNARGTGPPSAATTQIVAP